MYVHQDIRVWFSVSFPSVWFGFHFKLWSLFLYIFILVYIYINQIAVYVTSLGQKNILVRRKAKLPICRSGRMIATTPHKYIYTWYIYIYIYIYSQTRQNIERGMANNSTPLASSWLTQLEIPKKRKSVTWRGDTAQIFVRSAVLQQFGNILTPSLTTASLSVQHTCRHPNFWNSSWCREKPCRINFVTQVDVSELKPIRNRQKSVHWVTPINSRCEPSLRHGETIDILTIASFVICQDSHSVFVIRNTKSTCYD